MAGERIGEFSIEVTPDTSKFSSSLQRSLKGVGGSLGTLHGRLDSLGETITRRVGGAFKTMAKVGGAAIAGLVGSALFKGGQRVLGIEEANSRLESMGLNVKQVDRLSDNLLATLKGTPFHLDKGATSMAALVAAGTPLEDVNRNMELIVDAAAFAKVPLDDIADVFQTIQSRGKLTGEELNRFADRGVPALTLLADAAGVSAEEFQELVSSGAVDAEEFFDLWEDGAKGFGENNAVMEGAAKKMGETTRGALSNLMAAMGRLGSSVLVNLLEPFRQGVGGATSAVDDLTEVVGPLAERFAAWAQETIQAQVIPALQRMADLFRSEIVPRLQAFVEWVVDNQESIRSWAGTVATAVGIVGGLAFGIHAITRAFQILAAATPVGILLLIVTALVRLYQTNERFRDAVNNAFQSAVDVIGRFSGAIGGAESATGVFREGIARVVGIVQTALPTVIDIAGRAFQSILDFARQIWPQVSAIIDTVLAIITEVVRNFVTNVQGIWDRWGATILRVARVIWDGIREVIRAALQIIQGILNVFLGVIRGDWSKVWQGIRQILAGVWNAMFGIIRAAVRTVVAVIAGFITQVRKRWNEFWDGVRTKVSNVFGAVGKAAGNFVSALSRAFGRIQSAVRGPINFAINAFNTLIIAWNKVVRALGFSNLAVGTIGNVGVRTAGSGSGRGGVSAFRTGGSVFGKRGRDKIPAWLTHDEHVWTPEEVKAAGGHDSVHALRTAVLHARGLRPEALLEILRRGFIRPTGGDPTFRSGGAVGFQRGGAARGWTPPRGYVRYIKRLVRRLRNGRQIFEDFSFPGMGRFGRKYNDDVADRFYRTHRGFDFGAGGSRNQRQTILRALRSWIPEGFAAGGMVVAKNFARKQHGKPYIWGGVGPRGFDCSGYQSAILNVLEGKNPYSRRFTTASIRAGPSLAAGMGPRLGYSIGSYFGNPGHMAGTLGGVAVESGGSPSLTKYARGASSASYPRFNRKFHAKKGGLAISFKKILAKVASPIIGTILRGLSGISGGTGDGVGALARGMINTVRDNVFTVKNLEAKVNEAMEAFRRGGAVRSFQTGGPVLHDQIARVHKGEHVLSALQVQALQRQQTGGVNVRVFVGDREISDIVRVEMAHSARTDRVLARKRAVR